MINNEELKFLLSKYNNIIINKRKHNILELISKNSIYKVKILIEGNSICFDDIYCKESNRQLVHRFNIPDNVNKELHMTYIGIKIINNIISKGYMYFCNNIDLIQEESIHKHLDLFYVLLDSTGILNNAIIYDDWDENFFSVFTTDKQGISGYLCIDQDCYAYKIADDKLTEMYDFFKKESNVESFLNNTDESILKSYLENEGFNVACEMLLRYPKLRPTDNYDTSFICFHKLRSFSDESLSKLINNNNQLKIIWEK